MEITLQLCADLKAIFRRQSGAWLDRATLRRVEVLCEGVHQAARDAHARAEIARVAHYAKRLHTHRDPRIDLLREQVLLSLDAVEHRLHIAHREPRTEISTAA